MVSYHYLIVVEKSFTYVTIRNEISTRLEFLFFVNFAACNGPTILIVLQFINGTANLKTKTFTFVLITTPVHSCNSVLIHPQHLL
jgi:hypothetical protein